MQKKITILFPCVGRRVSLLESFRRSAGELGIECEIVGTDIDNNSPALQLCDKMHIVGRIDSKDYFGDSLKIIKKYDVDLVVPTIDPDLNVWANHVEKLQEFNCKVLISSPEVISVCQDKRLTNKFLTSNGFDTPAIFDIEELLSGNDSQYPYFLKPWNGSAARGNQVVKNREELEFFSKRIPNCIAQEYVKGVEYTIDSFIDIKGKIRCTVPRKRIEVRGGEVVKAVTEKNLNLIEQTDNMLSQLGAGFGVITTQCYLNKENQVKFIEINPRFGGGVPLSIKAGAAFPKWIIEMTFGMKSSITNEMWRDNLYMLRYDAEVWK